MFLPEYIDGNQDFLGVKGVCREVMSQEIPNGILVVHETDVIRVGKLFQRKHKDGRGAWFSVQQTSARRFSSFANEINISLVCLISDGDKAFDRAYQIMEGITKLPYPHPTFPTIGQDEGYSLAYETLAWRIDWSILCPPDTRPFPEQPGIPAAKFAFGETRLFDGNPDGPFRKLINRWWDRNDNSGVLE